MSSMGCRFKMLCISILCLVMFLVVFFWKSRFHTTCKLPRFTCCNIDFVLFSVLFFNRLKIDFSQNKNSPFPYVIALHFARLTGRNAEKTSFSLETTILFEQSAVYRDARFEFCWWRHQERKISLIYFPFFFEQTHLNL